MILAIKQWFRKLRSRLNAWLYIRRKKLENLVNSPGHVSDTFTAMIHIRTAEFLSVGPQEQVISGDSIIHIGESFFEAIPGVHCTGIGGDTTDTLLSRLDQNIVLFRPQKVLLHIGGNDFLAGKSVEHVYNNLKIIFRRLKAAGVKSIGWLEVVALADPRTSTAESIRDRAQYFDRVNSKMIPELSKLMGKATVRYRRSMQGLDGYILDKYRLPDGIHCNGAAYREVLVPVVRDWFENN